MYRESTVTHMMYSRDAYCTVACTPGMHQCTVQRSIGYNSKNDKHSLCLKLIGK